MTNREERVDNHCLVSSFHWTHEASIASSSALFVPELKSPNTWRNAACEGFLKEEVLWKRNKWRFWSLQQQKSIPASIFAPPDHGASASWTSEPMTSGPRAPDMDFVPKLYKSFSNFAFSRLGRILPPLLTVPWSHTWKLMAPEFVDDVELVASPRQSSPLPPVFSSFGSHGFPFCRSNAFPILKVQSAWSSLDILSWRGWLLDASKKGTIVWPLLWFTPWLKNW